MDPRFLRDHVRRWWDETCADGRFAVRTLLRTPAFTSAAVLTLALGIGTGTAIFSVVDAVVLKPLPFEEGERLVAVGTRPAYRPVGAPRMAAAEFAYFRERQRVFEQFAIETAVPLALHEPGRSPEEVNAQEVSAEFFEALRVAPLLGRTFSREDEVDGRHRVAVISHRLWQTRYGGSADVLGQTLPLDGDPYEVVGVTAKDFSYPVDSRTPTEVWVPTIVRFDDGDFARWGIGRLADGVTFAAARADMDRLAMEASPLTGGPRNIVIMPLHDYLIGRDARRWMGLLLGAAIMVLLIVYANVAGLLLTRATTRDRELAIRTSLGASWNRVARQLVVENVVLSGTGASLGLMLALWTVPIIRDGMPFGVPRVAAIQVNARVLAALALTATAMALLLGLVSAVQRSRRNLLASLNDGGRGLSQGRGRHRARSTLVVAQCAIAVILVFGAGLFIESFRRLVQVDLGFDPAGVLTATVPRRLDNASSPAGDVRALVARLRTAPGVQHASASLGPLPIALSVPQGGPDVQIMLVTFVTADYFSAMGIALRHGRLWREPDEMSGRPLAVINEAAATQFFAAPAPLGRVLPVEERWEVIGVVDTVKADYESAQVAQVYVPIRETDPVAGVELVVRTAGDPRALAGTVREATSAVLPHVALRDVQPLEERLTATTAQRRVSMLLMALFGIVGLSLATIGVYGVTAAAVAQRTQETGVRIALGATRPRVTWLFLRRAAVLTGAGTTIGLAGAWLLSASANAFLFDVAPMEPLVLTASVGVLVTAALLASAIPARRAGRTDAAFALRSEG